MELHLVLSLLLAWLVSGILIGMCYEAELWWEGYRDKCVNGAVCSILNILFFVVILPELLIAAINFFLPEGSLGSIS